MSIKKAVKEIKFELSEIESLFDLYKEELFELNREPNPVELTALASVLHSFYCGRPGNLHSSYLGKIQIRDFFIYKSS